MKLSDLADLVDGSLDGDPDAEISSVAAPMTAGPNDLAFVADEAGAELASGSGAGCFLKPPDVEIPFYGSIISVAEPKAAFARVAEVLHPRKSRPEGIHPSAAISERAAIGKNVYIGAYCCVGEGSSIGDGTHMLPGAKVGDGVSVGTDCTIHPNAFVEDGCKIGDRVIIKSGAVIGAKGFGFVRDKDKLVKFPQIGTVVIEDDVEIGANSCVDRGALGVTRIGEGTKLDNLVQVAHNVNIGKRVVIASQSGISGSVIIGDDCVVGGQVGFADHTEIEAGTMIGAKSAVFPGKKLRGGAWGGIPVRPMDEYKRLQAHIRALPKLRTDVESLKDLMDSLGRLIRRGSGE